MIPRLGTSVWEAIGDEPGRGGLVITLGEETCTVVDWHLGQVRYSYLPYSTLEERFGDGTLINTRAIRGTLRGLVADEARSKRIKHDHARRVLVGVLEQAGYTP